MTDPEKLLEKLEPLLPGKVEHWRRVLPFLDSETRSLLHQEIIATAQDVLGDVNRKLLLSLPDEKKAKGIYSLGSIMYEQEKWPFGLRKRELLQNMAILGRSGAGKTNVVFQLLTQLGKTRTPWLFLDWKRTARHLLPRLHRPVNIYTPGRSVSPLSFNPFIPPPGIELSVYLNLVVDTLASAFTLGDGAKSILQQALSECYSKQEAPQVHEVLKEVEAMPVKSRAHGWKLSALRALQSLDSSVLSGAGQTSQKELAKALLRQNSIIELDGLNDSAKKFFIPMLCLWLYYVRLGSERRETLELVIVVEEAHHIFYRQEHRSKESVMNMLMRQCRELGIAMVIVDQHPHLISSIALGNAYTSVCLNQKEPVDVNKAASLSLLSTEEKPWLSMLPVGSGIVKLQDRWHRPFLVKFPLVPVKKGAVSDSLLQRYCSGQMTLSALKQAVGRDFPQKKRFRVLDNALSNEELAFIEDVLQHELDGVNARYQRLGLSGDRGNRLKEELIDKGLLEPAHVKVGRTHRTLLRLTPDATRRFGIQDGRPFHGSLTHEYWKQFYADKFTKLGYTVQVEAHRPKPSSGNVDILCRKSAESVAVEIETGKSDVVSNVKLNLLAGYSKVIVVATDEKALETVQKQLAEARLVVPGRVQVVLKDKLDWDEVENGAGEKKR